MFQFTYVWMAFLGTFVSLSQWLKLRVFSNIATAPVKSLSVYTCRLVRGTGLRSCRRNCNGIPEISPFSNNDCHLSYALWIIICHIWRWMKLMQILYERKQTYALIDFTGMRWIVSDSFGSRYWM